MCTQKTIPEKPFNVCGFCLFLSYVFFLFSFLQVALFLEDHSSEVRVVKRLLHVGPHLPSPLQPLQESSTSTRVRAPFHAGPQKVLWEHGRLIRGSSCPAQFPCSVCSVEIPQPRMSLVSVLFTNVLLGTRADHSRCGWVNQGHIHSLAAILGANDLCHPFWPGLAQQLAWESVWIG